MTCFNCKSCQSLIAAISNACAFAQNSGTIVGTITDSSGTVISSAQAMAIENGYKLQQ
jgi:hypothetical protein